MKNLGFTVAELIFALSILVVVAGVGSQADLVDLLDKEEFLSKKGVKLDTPSIVETLKNSSVKDDQFFVQVLIAEIGDRRASSAISHLEHLAKNADYFVSKRAKFAIEQIQSLKAAQKSSVLDKIMPMLPDKSRLAFDGTADFKSNLKRIKKMYSPVVQNETVLMVQKQLGNVQIDSLYVVELGEVRKSYLTLAKGRFYQSKMITAFKKLKFQEVVESESVWVGSGQFGGANVLVVFSSGSAMALEIGLGSPLILDATKLSKIVKQLEVE